MKVLLVCGCREDEQLRDLIEAFHTLGHKTNVLDLSEYSLWLSKYDDAEIIFGYGIDTPQQRARFSRITRILNIPPATLQWCLKNLDALINLKTSSEKQGIQCLKRIASCNR